MEDLKTIKVGFIGIGNMGWPMAMNIHEAGYDLTVFDLDSARSESFAVETGARSAVSLAELGQMDFVITMLPNGHVVREVLMEGEDGAFIKNVKAGCIVIDMSSAEPTGTRALGADLARAQRHADRRTGIRRCSACQAGYACHHDRRRGCRGPGPGEAAAQ